MIQYLRSLIFVGQIYLMMALMAVAFTPFVLFYRPLAYTACRTWCRWVRWSAAWMVGLRTEVRGEVPTQECLIASKHQSFLDIILIVSEVPRPKFIMKRELQWVPIVGWYAKWIGCVPVDRGRRTEAIRQMKEGVAAGRAKPGQLIIYPQGTRVAPGVSRPYKIGAGILYEELEQGCVPAATNVGVFWPRTGIGRKPGLAVVEFLDPIGPGLPQTEFMKKLESVVETASDRLMADAGFTPLP
ncbi:lysophospholipid acyltransferase family protein [Tropicimonas sediminicola]|uniref:1-acyl-sn-glycerol-3-phosphate acyltransferase n=1 Tax=Tropicimonas sediminicola TaxID=1031541 RepID=A0A239I815_9RHOB|nr:lysophospholipid acyltransferase family protein [Tropicimonas sediminicola]SNS89689.1 1-acyl-sn-glycerol-3-phosphate acyltransferase [Tropicimonas sediminicola]